MRLPLHDEIAKVPLLIHVPGVKPGRTAKLACALDIAPTISELAGLSRQPEMQGSRCADPRRRLPATVSGHTPNRTLMSAWVCPAGKQADSKEEAHDQPCWLGKPRGRDAALGCVGAELPRAELLSGRPKRSGFASALYGSAAAGASRAAS